MTRKQLQTLVFVKQNKKILLGYKLRGFGQGKWNGYGGKLEKDETIKTCAQRELFEESNLKVHEDDLIDIGYIEFYKYDGIIDRRVQIFICNKVGGVEGVTDEMKPQWFAFNKIPYESMWQDTKFWMKYVLEGQYFEASFQINNNGDVIKYKINN